MELEERRDWLAKEKRIEGIPDQVWELLVERKYAREDMDETDEEILVEKTTDLLAVAGTGTRPSGRQKKEEREDEISAWLDDADRERRNAFAEHVARMAAEHPGVQAFRSEILGERFPLSYEEALEEFVDEDGAIHGPNPYAEHLAELTEELESLLLEEVGRFMVCVNRLRFSREHVQATPFFYAAGSWPASKDGYSDCGALAIGGEGPENL